MLLILKSSIFINSSSYLPFVRRRRRRRFVTKMSKRKDRTAGVQSSRKQQQQPSFLRVSNTVVARSVVAVFGLGFIDAGYSGDWSRIGMISKEIEDVLKIAAFIVIPLCIFLIFSFSKDPAD